MPDGWSLAVELFLEGLKFKLGYLRIGLPLQVWARDAVTGKVAPCCSLEPIAYEELMEYSDIKC